jgi:hypothetical protein
MDALAFAAFVVGIAVIVLIGRGNDLLHPIAALKRDRDSRANSVGMAGGFLILVAFLGLGIATDPGNWPAVTFAVAVAAAVWAAIAWALRRLSR